MAEPTPTRGGIVFGSEQANKLRKQDLAAVAMRDSFESKYGSIDGFLKAIEQKEAEIESETTFLNHLKDGSGTEQEVEYVSFQIFCLKSELLQMEKQKQVARL